MSTPPLTPSEREELEELRRRVSELDAELVEQARRTNRLVAEAQERAYWLERWHFDLNAFMARPGMAELRLLVRILRRPVRLARRIKHRVLG